MTDISFTELQAKIVKTTQEKIHKSLKLLAKHICRCCMSHAVIKIWKNGDDTNDSGSSYLCKFCFDNIKNTSCKDIKKNPESLCPVCFDTDGCLLIQKITNTLCKDCFIKIKKM